MALPEPTYVPEDEYLAFDEQSEMRNEYINGQIYSMTGGSEPHLRIISNAHATLHTLLRGSSCTVYPVEMRVQLSAAKSYFYPDITIVCGEGKFQEDEAIATLLNPTVLIEVLSPSTELRDRTTKLSYYQRFSTLQDYVLIAQVMPKAECYSRAEGGAWMFRLVEGLEASLTIPGIDCTLQLADVYEGVRFADTGPPAR